MSAPAAQQLATLLTLDAGGGTPRRPLCCLQVANESIGGVIAKALWVLLWPEFSLL